MSDQPGPSDTRGVRGDETGVAYQGSSSTCQETEVVRKLSKSWSLSTRQRQVMKTKDITDTASLVRCYNEARDDEEKEVLMDCVKECIHWINTPSRTIDEEDWKAYLELGKIECYGEKTFWLQWLHSILKNVHWSEPIVIESLELALRMIPSENFEENLCHLTDIANQSLEILNPQKEMLVKQNFTVFKPILLVLHQVFILMDQTAPNSLDEGQEFYQSVMDHLVRIKENQTYYPIYFFACLVEQGLCCLKKKDSTLGTIKWLKRGIIGTKAIVNIWNFGSKAIKLEFDLEALETAIKSLKKLLRLKEGLKEKWYYKVNYLNAMAIKCCHDQSFLGDFIEEASAYFEDDASVVFQYEDVKDMQYAIIGQLQMITCESKNTHAKKDSMDLLLTFAEQYKLNGSGYDLDIYEAMLNALGYVHSSVDVEEKERIETTIETMINTDNEQLKACYYSWLGGLSLKERLLKFVQPTKSHKTKVFFQEIMKETKVCTQREIDNIKEELKRQYLDDHFAKVSSLFDNKDRHVSEFEFSLVRFEKVKDIDAKNEDTDRNIDRAKEHYKDVHMIAKKMEIEDLFTTKISSGTTASRDINKVLLFGYPGTGKTSMTKKLAYLWSEGNWGKDFEYMFVVQVRSLSNEEYNGDNTKRMPTLATAITKLCFKAREENQFKILKNHVHDVLQEKTTLIVIDGLDEWDGKCKEIIQDAKECKCKLLFSGRPYDLDDERRIVDYEAECLGLDDDQLHRFITKEIPNDQIDRLVFVLKKNRRVWQWAHVPITATIICFLWRHSDDKILEDNTFKCINSLYTNLVKCVWRRYTTDLKVKYDEEKAMHSLRKIAFEAFLRDQIFINPKMIHDQTDYQLQDILQASGFLLLKMEGELYHFPHLTFQEYFVGQYLAKYIKDSNDKEHEEVLKFIQENKYKSRYEVVMRFFVEALRDSKKITFNELIFVIDDKPIDIIEWNHSLYKLWILDGWLSVSNTTLEQSQIQSKSSKKIVDDVHHIIHQCSNNVLMFNFVCEKLKRCEEVISHLPSLQSDIFCKVLMHTKSSNWQVRLSIVSQAIEFAKMLPNQSEQILEEVLISMGDLAWPIRKVACEQALDFAKMLPSKSEIILAQVLKLMKDFDYLVRCVTTRQALDFAKILTNKSETILAQVLKLLEDDRSWDVLKVALEQAQDFTSEFPQMSERVEEQIAKVKESYGSEFLEFSNVEHSNHGRTTTLESEVLTQFVLKIKEDEDKSISRSTSKQDSELMDAKNCICTSNIEEYLQLMTNNHLHTRVVTVGVALTFVRIVPNMSIVVFEQVLKSMEDSSWVVRQGAVKQALEFAKLLPRKSEQILEKVLILMEDTDWHVRESATQQTLGFAKILPSRDEEIYEKVSNSMEEKVSWEVRTSAIDQASEFANLLPNMTERIVDQILTLVDDTDPDVRRAAKIQASRIAKIFPNFHQKITAKVPSLIDEDMNVGEASTDSIHDDIRTTSPLSEKLVEEVLNWIKTYNEYNRNAAVGQALHLAKNIPSFAKRITIKMFQLIDHDHEGVSKSARTSFNEILKCLSEDTMRSVTMHIVDTITPINILRRNSKSEALLSIPGDCLVKLALSNYPKATECFAFYALKHPKTYRFDSSRLIVTVRTHREHGSTEVKRAARSIEKFVKQVNKVLLKAYKTRSCCTIF